MAAGLIPPREWRYPRPNKPDLSDLGPAKKSAVLNPLVQLIWIGIGIMVLGGMFVLIPNKQLGPAVALKKPSSKEVRDKAA